MYLVGLVMLVELMSYPACQACGAPVWSLRISCEVFLDQVNSMALRRYAFQVSSNRRTWIL